MANPVYVPCNISRGIFEDEFYVSVGTSSVYADRSQIRFASSPVNGHAVEGKMLAYLVEERNDAALVELPGEPVVGGLRAWVRRSDLAEANDIEQ